ncbi:hypothetical protein P3T18_007110, partial [Paraburkholderia sp. GAS199]
MIMREQPLSVKTCLTVPNSQPLTYIANFSLFQTQKPRLLGRGFCLLLGSLTITYFHTGIRTIIGVESFHGP